MMESVTATSARVDDTATIEILLVDDQLILCAGLRKLIHGEPGFTVVASASDPYEAVQLVEACRPDIVIVRLTGGALVRLLRMLQELTAAGNPARIIVLAKALEKTEIFQLLQIGASGILLEQTSPQLLFDSVRSVMGGYCWLGREQLDDLAEGLRRLNPTNGNRFGLTPRELEITESVRGGDSNRVIARKHRITLDTVKHHLTNIYRKVGVGTRLQLAVVAINHNLLEGVGHNSCIGDAGRGADGIRHSLRAEAQ